MTYTNTWLFLCQAKYARDILTRSELLDSKPISTPLAVGHALTSIGSPYSTHYRSFVDALQYFMITIPDLSFAVNLLSQLLQALTENHYQVAKRIFTLCERYYQPWFIIFSWFFLRLGGIFRR